MCKGPLLDTTHWDGVKGMMLYCLPFLNQQSSAASELCLLRLEVPVDQVEEESDEPEEVDEDEADEDSLRDPDEIVHGASLKC